MVLERQIVDKRVPPLPPPESSIALTTYRLEEIARAIQKSVRKKARRPRLNLRVPAESYIHFRRQAYELLSYYVDHDLQPAFTWLLAMHDKAPKRLRGSVRGNDFHLGLLAMTAAAGQFMHRNKLRELATAMQRAHAEGISKVDFERFRNKLQRVGRYGR